MNMREAINVTKILLEAPGLLSGTEDFGLNDRSINLQKASYFASPNARVIEDFPAATLFRLGTDYGAIGLVSKADKKLHYYVKYESMKLPLTGSTVTQVELWRSQDVDRYVPNYSITRYVFFDVLLPSFGAVMSDSLQTHQGAGFWRRVLNMALAKNLTIEMADLGTGQIDTYDGGVDLDDWLIGKNPWGAPGNPKQKRLIIRQ